uniref:Putative UDP-N-acetylglucosamine pyrophosphorylase n=1 Tax=Rhizophora mucronata TaxID=61149 RepID=A0A2P2LK36_RHIMU
MDPRHCHLRKLCSRGSRITVRRTFLPSGTSSPSRSATSSSRTLRA